jgi:hypothetical protein
MSERFQFGNKSDLIVRARLYFNSSHIRSLLGRERGADLGEDESLSMIAQIVVANVKSTKKEVKYLSTFLFVVVCVDLSY